MAEPLDPSFFDFDVGEPLSKEELKGVYGLLLGLICVLICCMTVVRIYEEITRGDLGCNPLLLAGYS